MEGKLPLLDLHFLSDRRADGPTDTAADALSGHPLRTDTMWVHTPPGADLRVPRACALAPYTPQASGRGWVRVRARAARPRGGRQVGGPGGDPGGGVRPEETAERGAWAPRLAPLISPFRIAFLLVHCARAIAPVPPRPPGLIPPPPRPPARGRLVSKKIVTVLREAGDVQKPDGQGGERAGGQHRGAAGAPPPPPSLCSFRRRPPAWRLSRPLRPPPTLRPRPRPARPLNPRRGSTATASRPSAASPAARSSSARQGVTGSSCFGGRTRRWRGSSRP